MNIKEIEDLAAKKIAAIESAEESDNKETLGKIAVLKMEYAMRKKTRRMELTKLRKVAGAEVEQGGAA